MNKYILSGIILMLGFCGYVLGVDLAEQVATRFQPDYDLGLADKYLQFPYTGNFLKDPFLNAMDVYEGMSAQARVAGVKYVERALTLKGCGLSNEKQWAILYYYVPEFRSEIARDLKMNGGDYGSENYIFDDNVMLDYCTEFYNCITKESGGEDDGDTKKITSGTPEDIKTNCKEFFQTNYREGQAEEKRVQNLQIAWLGNDKYVNATTDESPYDVMRDLGIIGELSYLKPQFPITPIFYDLPIFAKSKEALLNNKNGGGGDCVEETYGGIAPFEEEISLGGISKDLDKSPSLEKQVNNGGTSSITEKTVSLDKEFVVGNQGLEKQVSVGGNSNSVEKSVSLNGTQAVGQNVQVKDSVNNGVIGQNDAVLAGGQSNGSVKPLKSLTVEGYDDLLEGLGAYRLKEDKSAYYGSLCRDVEESAKEEVEPEAKFVEEETVTVTRDEIMPGEAPSLTKVEYKELVDYMTEAVNSYASLSEEKKKEIGQKAGDVSKYNGATTAEQTEAVAKKILGCYQSCEGLNVDGQFACMLKCSCGEITSPIFDPEINPGMGPIFMIRYCAVPAVNPRYYYEGSDGTDSWSSTLLKGVKSSIGGLFGNGSSGGGSNGGGTSGGGSSGGGNTGGGRSGGGGNGGGTSGGGNAGGGSCSGGGNGGSNEAIVPSFNVGGKTIVGMEEGINEIHGVVDKLAREGRLGIWTQQYNFFDSSTKLTDIADTFSFTMSAEKKSIKQKVGEPTEEYKKRVMKTRNYNWLVANHVANPIDNPATRNWYLLVGYEGEVVGDIVASANADMSRQSQGYLNVAPSFIVDQSENSNAARYAKISELFSDWLDEQGDFWAQKVDYLNELDSYAKALYAKKG